MVNDKTNRKGKKMSDEMFIGIDPNYQGTIPSGYDLVAVEQSDVDNETFESAVILYGFDEIYSLADFDFVNPVLGFLSSEKSVLDYV